MSQEEVGQLLEHRRQLHQVCTFISAAASLEELLPGAQSRILELLGAERSTIFSLDTRNRQLYSLAKTGDELKEIRVPLDPSSIAGFVGVAKAPVVIVNAYDAAELKRLHPQLQFDDRWDKASGFVTRSVLCVPVLYEGNLLGAVQVINRRDRQPFATRDEMAAEEIAQSLGLAFFNLNRMRALAQARKPTRWDGLIDSGAISEVELERAASDAAANRLDLPRWLMERVGIPRQQVERSLAQFYNAEFFRPTPQDAVVEDLRKKVKVEFFRQVCAAPIERRPGALVVAIDDPHDLGRADAMRALEPAQRLELRVGFRDEILALIEASYGLRQDVGKIISQLSAESPAIATPEDVDETRVAESDSAVIKLANQIIADAYKKGASDIHIEPYGKEKATVVRFRIDGD